MEAGLATAAGLLRSCRSCKRQGLGQTTEQHGQQVLLQLAAPPTGWSALPGRCVWVCLWQVVQHSMRPCIAGAGCAYACVHAGLRSPARISIDGVAFATQLMVPARSAPGAQTVTQICLP
jgi:hypothetical protein